MLLTRFVIAASCMMLLAPLASAQIIIIEAEDYIASNDIGGAVIQTVLCSAASGGEAVEGFDTPGEWIEVILNASHAGSFADWIRSAGLNNYESDLRSTIFGGGPGGADLVSAYHTVGLGIG
jgi:hypothetical protein